MLAYLMRRLFQSLVFVILSTFIAYTAVVYMPGGPAVSYVPLKAQLADDPASLFASDRVEFLENYYEVDKPWPINYFAWLFDPTETSDINDYRERVPKGIDISIGDWHIKGSGILTGDFGRVGGIVQSAGDIENRLALKPTVASQIGMSWGNTALLVGLALLLSVLVALPLGIIVSARPGSLLDRMVTVMSSFALSLPLYGIAYLLITALAIVPYYLYLNLGWDWLPRLPGGSPYSSSQENNPINRLYHAILPATTLAIPQIAIISKYVRTSMLDVLGLDYIRTAWAKGLPAWRVLGKHAFRNALLPIITVVGLALPGIASGTIVVEYAFTYHGLGYLTFNALGGCAPTEDRPCDGGTGFPMDFGLLVILLVLLVVVVSLANMLADIMYTVADPRVEYGGQKAQQHGQGG